MPTASNLINIDPLVTTDPFETWYSKFNEIVADINPLQVYDVDVSATGGLGLATGISAGNYNGVVTLNVNQGPGIGNRTLAGKNYTIIDFGQFTTFGLGSTAGASGYYVLPNDEFIFNAKDDYSGGPYASGNPATSGTTKSVKARNMLPSVVDLPGNGLNLNGNVTISGDLVINGSNTFIAAQNLNIEDKTLSLAYQQSATLQLTGGVTASTFTLGATAYHFAASTGLTPDIQGYIQSYTGPAVGPTGTLVVGYPFGTNQSAQTFNGVTGYMSSSPTGATRYLVQSAATLSNAYLNDANLNQAGIVVKGASGDKIFWWVYDDADTGLRYNAWISNTNLGLSGSDSALISRVYRSFGYTGVNQSQFIFASEATKTPEIYITTLGNNTSPLTFTGGSWKISKETGNVLTFAVGSTGIDNVSTSFAIAAGSSGQTFSGITAYNFARQLNVDMLDGAHGYTGSTAFSIPISDSFGRLDEGWLNAASMRKRLTQAAHGFTAGDVIRAATSGSYAKAIATYAEYAEAIGIVSEVHDANTFTVTYKGRITGLTGAQMTVEGSAFSPGNVYFLSAGTAGKLIADPDNAVSTKLTSGQVRKPMLLAVSATEGFVLNYLGTKMPTPQDEVYLSGLVPVGSIYPFAGDTAYVPREWLICDGDRYKALDYPDLYTVIGRTYYTNIAFSATGITGTLNGGVRGLQTGDIVSISGVTAAVVSKTDATSTVSFDKSFSSGTKTLNVQTNSSGENLFFVPDLRTRVIMGGTTGSTGYSSGTGLSGYTVGSFGGAENVTLTTGQLPAHSHTLNASTISTSGAGSGTVVSGGGSISTSSVGSNEAVDIHQPYLVTNFIIKATKSVEATVLTGHNHDERYVRFDNAPTLQTAFGVSGGVTAANFRNKIGVYGTSEVYSQTQSDARYYTMTASDQRFINNGGDTGVSGTYYTIGNFVLDTTTDSSDTIEFKGIVKNRLVNQGAGLGFSVVADNTVMGTTGGDYNILQLFSSGSSAVYPNSRAEIYLNGDFTVAGDGLASSGLTGHLRPVFSVDPFVSSVSIAGGFTSGIGLAPTLVFVNEADTNAFTGKITGLTAPTLSHGAANKYYVDSMLGANWGTVDASTVSGSTSYTTPTLTPGVYQINVVVFTASTAEDDSTNSAWKLTVDGTTYINRRFRSEGGTELPLPFTIVKSVAGTSITISTLTSLATLSMVSWARLGNN